MKKQMLVLGATAVFAISTGAGLAADLSVRAPVYKAPPMAVSYYNWAGLYVGGHAGYGWGNPVYTNTLNTSNFGNAQLGQSFSQQSQGFVGGGQVGYNWQANQWVYGLEADLSYARVRGSSTNFVDDVFTNRLQSILLLTGRLGYSWDNFLLYGKGGYAGGRRSASVIDTIPSGGTGGGSASNWHSGWTAGAGVEYGLTANWIAGLEYDYVRLDTKTFDLDRTASTYVFGIKSDYHVLTGRLSYKF